MFRSKPEKNSTIKQAPQRGSYRPSVMYNIIPFTDLWRGEHYQHIMQNIENSLPELNAPVFQACYIEFLQQFLSYTQMLPESGQYGLMSLFHQGLLRGYGMHLAVCEYYQQSEHSRDPWQAASKYVAFTAGVLMDIYQVQTNYQVVFCHPMKGTVAGHWNPLLGSLTEQAKGHGLKIYAIDSGLGHMVGHFNLLLARACMPATGRQWIGADQRMLSEWIHLLVGEQSLWGPFAHALEHHKRFTDGLELPPYLLDEIEAPDMAAGDAFYAWLQQLTEHEQAAMKGMLRDSDWGVALDLPALAREFAKSPAGRVLSETVGSTIALHAAVISQFRDLFPMGVDAQIKARHSGLGLGVQTERSFLISKDSLPAGKGRGALPADTHQVIPEKPIISHGVQKLGESMPAQSKTQTRTQNLTQKPPGTSGRG